MIALFGPTAVGKTAVARALADRLRERGEDPVAISADALQVYRGLETLTAAATAAERRHLEHRLQSFVPVESTFSAGEYMGLAHREIDEALAAGRRPIVVGGTGLYVRAALSDLELRPPPPPEVRERIERELERRGAAAMHAELAAREPRLASTVPLGDRSRIVRVLELVEIGEDPYPEPEPGRSQLWTAETRHPTLLVGLVMRREALYERIDRRSEQIATKARDEVRRAAARGASRTAREAIGFEELLRGDVEAMKRETRRYAKRQLTWMRKLAGVRTVDVTDREPAEAAAEIDALAR